MGLASRPVSAREAVGENVSGTSQVSVQCCEKLSDSVTCSSSNLKLLIFCVTISHDCGGKAFQSGSGLDFGHSVADLLLCCIVPVHHGQTSPLWFL